MELSSCPQCTTRRNIPDFVQLLPDESVSSGPVLQALQRALCAHNASAHCTVDSDAGAQHLLRAPLHARPAAGTRTF